MPKAFISGLSGQDGALLADVLLKKGYEVVGSSRDPKDPTRLWRLDQLGIRNDIDVVASEVSKPHLLDQFQPDEIYNLEGQSSVADSFKQPHDTIVSNGISSLDWLEAVRLHGQHIKFYQASSAEIFGASKDFSRGENSPVHPRSPYAVSKLFSHYITVNYREAYGLYASCGILFNHESCLRGKQFVTQKIAQSAAQWSLGHREPLAVGNMYVKRDWGHAVDFVHGMYLILQQDQPDDYVLATGELHSVKDFIQLAFEVIGVALKWEGEGMDEVGIDQKTGELCVKVDAQFYRPSDMEQSLGNPIKARNVLNWKPKFQLEDVVQEMVQAHLATNSSNIS
jgi:GDPmannose 4,6-dehydratase